MSDIARTTVLYSTDARFLPVTCISARSIKEHCCDPPPVTVLLHGVSETLAQRAGAFLAGAGMTVRFVTVDPSWCEPWASGRGQSAAKFGPLRMSEWLQEGTERVIAVDSDTRFTGDIGELVKLDLQDAALAAVDDMAVVADGMLPRFRDKLAMPADAGYFNSGLMVVDVARWRADGIGPAATAVFTERPEILTYNDQCALNAVLAGKYLRLPFRWNSLNGSAPADWPACLVHYAGHFKPWNLGPLSRRSDMAGFVGRQHIEYYDAAMSELRAARLAPGTSLKDTLRQLSIYAKWRLSGKLRKARGRAESAHLQTHISNHPQLMD